MDIESKEQAVDPCFLRYAIADGIANISFATLGMTEWRREIYNDAKFIGRNKKRITEANTRQ